MPSDGIITILIIIWTPAIQGSPLPVSFLLLLFSQSQSSSQHHHICDSQPSCVGKWKLLIIIIIWTPTIRGSNVNCYLAQVIQVSYQGGILRIRCSRLYTISGQLVCSYIWYGVCPLPIYGNAVGRVHYGKSVHDNYQTAPNIQQCKYVMCSFNIWCKCNNCKGGSPGLLW